MSVNVLKTLVGMPTKPLHESGLPSNEAAVPCENTGMAALNREIAAAYFDTTRLFFTENTFGTPFARKPAKFLSVSLSATPSSVTFPFFTMI